MIILGIDPGTIKTGYAVIEVIDGQMRVLDYGCIRPPADWKLTDRYLVIYESVLELVIKYTPTDVALETQFVHKNPSTALKLGMARGIAMIAAKQKGCAIYEYAPKKAKMAAVGQGNASKTQVQTMLKMLLNLGELPQEDAADALALALCHIQNTRYTELLSQEI